MAAALLNAKTFGIRSGNCWIRFYSRKSEFKKFFAILEIDEASNREQIREAYLKLVKRYHPDNPDGGDIERFQKVDEAFRKLSNAVLEVEQVQEEIQEQDIKHTAPQHRHYLSYDGIGSGTPFQREKQYIKHRASQAADNILQHRISKVTADEKSLIDKQSNRYAGKHKIQTKYGFDRLVEDLIQESMAKGEFNNLSGCGKPLQTFSNLNPYVDFVTHKLNQVLIDNGFTPEWILLQKEIREEKQELLDSLIVERANFGSVPLNEHESHNWNMVIEKYSKIAAALNKKIDKFNLVVPILDKQMLHVDLGTEAGHILASNTCKVSNSRMNDETSIKVEPSIMSFLEKIFSK